MSFFGKLFSGPPPYAVGDIVRNKNYDWGEITVTQCVLVSSGKWYVYGIPSRCTTDELCWPSDEVERDQQTTRNRPIELEPRKLALPRGVRRKPYKGRNCILIDVSGSMYGVREELAKELAVVESIVYEFRLFVFADEAKETTCANFVQDCDGVGGGTTMMKGLEIISKLNPEKTVIMSDGYTCAQEECLKTARGMTGAVYAFGSCPEDFMRQLGGCGGGAYYPIYKSNASWTVDIRKFQIAMAKSIGYTPIFEERYCEPEFIRQGAPTKQRIGFRPASFATVSAADVAAKFRK